MAVTEAGLFSQLMRPVRAASHRSQLLGYAGLYSVTAGFLRLAGFILFLWFARSLSVYDYATFGLLYALQTGVVTFGLAGVFEAIVGLLRKYAPGPQRRGLYAAASWMMVWMIAVACGIAALVFVLVSRRSGVGVLAVTAALGSGALLAFAAFQSQLVRLEEKHASSLLFNFVAPLCGLAGGFLVFLLRRTVDAFFLGSILGLVVVLAALWRYRERLHAGAQHTASTQELFFLGAPYIVVAIFGWLSGYGSNYIVNGFFESVEVARFTFALMLSSILQLVATALNQVWSPRFYNITHVEPLDQVEHKNRRFFRGLAVTLGLLAGVLVVIVPAVTHALGGNLAAYDSMRLELALVLVSYVVIVPWWHCQNYFLAYGRGPELMRVIVTTGVLGVGTMVVLMWLLGPIGIYIGFLAQIAFRVIGVVTAARRHWALMVPWEGMAVGVLLTIVGLLLSNYRFE